MKKLIMLAALIVVTGLIAGCSSVPKHCNMTGAWNYKFEENGKSGTQNGSMTLIQDSYKLQGKCIDAFGEFALTGSIAENSPKLVIDGKRADDKRNFHLIATLTSDNEFEGTYTTDQNTSGTLKGSRITAE